MTEIFFGIDRHNVRLTVRRLEEDGSLTIAVYDQNNDRVFHLSPDDAAKLAAAINSPRV